MTAPGAAAVPAGTELEDVAACGLLLAGTDGTIRRVNRMACDWLGRDADDLVGRRTVQELLTVGCRIFHQTHVLPLLQMQGAVSEVQLDVLHRDGRKIPVLLNVVRRQHADGTAYDAFAMMVTEDRRTYERELLLARKHAEQSLAAEQRAQAALAVAQASAEDRALFAEQMVGIVSHDLRNPLAVVTMSSQLLRRDGLTERQGHVVARIDRATQRAQRLIADLLDFTAARIGTGIAVRRRPLVLQALVADAVEELRQAFPMRKLEHVHTGGDAPFEADSDRLAQLIGNLVGNAVVYGAPDMPVRVTSLVAAEHVEIAVHNRGSVIPADQIDALFEPLARGAGVEPNAGSVGLGLFIVREIARAHGGKAGAVSSAKDGTVFSVRLPRIADTPTSAPRTPPPA